MRTVFYDKYLMIGIAIMALALFSVCFALKQKHSFGVAAMRQELIVQVLTGDAFDQLPGSRMERLLMLGRVLLDRSNQPFSLSNSQVRYITSRFNQDMIFAVKEYVDDFYSSLFTRIRG